MEYRRTEIRAGIFLLASFIVLVVMVFTVSDIESLFKSIVFDTVMTAAFYG